jgi:HK97 gp10 family phage protein
MNNGSIRVDVVGFDKLMQQLKALSDDKDKRRETLILLREVARPTIQAAKQLAPIAKRNVFARGKVIQPGTLKRSIGAIAGRKSVNPTIYAGPRAKGANDGWFGHFVHDGHNLYRKGFKRKHTKGGNAAGVVSRTKANPFMTNAYRATEGVVTADAEKRMVSLIQRRINKLS